MKPTLKFISAKKSLLAVCLCILIVLISYYWYRLPEQTWENFLVALEEGNIATANSYCDQSSLKVESRPGENPEFQFLLRPGIKFEWMGYFPIQPETLRKHYSPRTASYLKRLKGEMQVANPGSIYYGHFEIHQNKIYFVPDMSSHTD